MPEEGVQEEGRGCKREGGCKRVKEGARGREGVQEGASPIFVGVPSRSTMFP